MPISLRAFSTLLAVGVLVFVSGLHGQDRPLAPATAGETVNVEVKIVPFYAVDAQGRPVYDLKPEEVELRVGGAVVPIESFDRYVIQSGKAGVESSPLTPTPSRTVFFLFDQAFSSPAGFNADKELAARMVRSWPGGDRLFLIAHGSRAGLERKLGPVPPDAEGKKELLAAIDALQPEIRRLGLQDNPATDFGPPAERASRGQFSGTAPNIQMGSVYDGIQGGARGEYGNAARGFAVSLSGFADELKRISGPKLLVLFSQGMDDGLYFQGDSGFKVGTDESVQVDSRRAPPLVDRFREPLAALAASGAVAVFVNTDRGQGIDADSVLRHMAKTTGALYLEGRDTRDLETRIAGSTTAYYEAAFHPGATLLQRDSAGVEVAVRRPGVRAWAPAAVRTRESYRGLSGSEKRRLVIDLVAGGPAAQRAHSPVRLSVQNLDGKVLGRGAAGDPRLRFEAAWPADVATRKLDLYNVLMAVPAADRKGKILRFDARESLAAADRAALETTLEGEGALVWGVVAVDPETQQAWIRRLSLRAPGKGAR
jgi:hypothetical protein